MWTDWYSPERPSHCPTPYLPVDAALGQSPLATPCLQGMAPLVLGCLLHSRASQPLQQTGVKNVGEQCWAVMLVSAEEHMWHCRTSPHHSSHPAMWKRQNTHPQALRPGCLDTQIALGCNHLPPESTVWLLASPQPTIWPLESKDPGAYPLPELQDSAVTHSQTL